MTQNSTGFFTSYTSFKFSMEANISANIFKL